MEIRQDGFLVSNEEILSALLISCIMEMSPKPFGEISEESIKEFGRIVTTMGKAELERRGEFKYENGNLMKC